MKTLLNRTNGVFFHSVLLALALTACTQGPEKVALDFAQKGLVGMHFDEAVTLVSKQSLGNRQPASLFKKERQMLKGLEGLGEYLVHRSKLSVLEMKQDGNHATVRLQQEGPPKRTWVDSFWG